MMRPKPKYVSIPEAYIIDEVLTNDQQSVVYNETENTATQVWPTNPDNYSTQTNDSPTIIIIDL
jgi:hypothetical protein